MKDQIEQIGGVTLSYKYYSGNDLYQDGFEDKLLDIVQNHKPEQFNEIIRQSSEWAVLYHLSHIRGNILSWYPIQKSDKVLEIGAGCGAITGELAKKSKSVDCIELSKKRSLVNAWRNREYNNITIHVGNFQDIEKNITEKYDVITLIGVFEYARSYIQDEFPFDKFLCMIKNHLSENGKVMIAIENKFGLKYFAGCKEDHLSTYYSGLEGYQKEDGVCTFSKDELEKMGQACGFSDITFYYPYPDYKLPMAIYSDEYLPKPGELTNNFRNFDNDRMVSFNESKVYDEIIKDGKFPFFSNSFLVVMGDN